MANLTKQLSESLAFSLTAKIRENIQRKRMILGEYVLRVYLDQVPVEEWDMIQKLNSSWFEKRSSISITSDRGRSITVNCNSEVIMKPRQYNVFVEQLIYDHIVKQTNEIETLKSEYKNTYTQLTQLILRFQTFNKLEKEFPEAYELIPKDQISKSGAVIAIPTSTILDKINQLSTI